MEGKYYWLKLPKDFLKRHDIVFLKSLPQGEKIVFIYLQLMLESIDHEGELRFSEDIPYTTPMLASITNYPEELIETTMNLLASLDLVEIDEDETIRLPKVIKMIGSASASDEARRSKRYREKKKAERDESSQENVTPVTDDVTKSNESKSKSKSIEIDIKRNTKEKRFSVPTLEEVSSYCQERNNGVDAERFINYYESKGWKVGSSPMKDWRAAVRTWEKNYTAKPCEPTASKYDINWDEV